MMTFALIFFSLPGTFLLALIIQELITKKWLSGEYLRRSVFLMRFLTLQGITLGLCIQKNSPWLYLVLIMSAFSLFWMFARFREQDKGSNPIRWMQQTKRCSQFSVLDSCLREICRSIRRKPTSNGEPK